MCMNEDSVKEINNLRQNLQLSNYVSYFISSILSTITIPQTEPSIWQRKYKRDSNGMHKKSHQSDDMILQSTSAQRIMQSWQSISFQPFILIRASLFVATWGKRGWYDTFRLVVLLLGETLRYESAWGGSSSLFSPHSLLSTRFSWQLAGSPQCVFELALALVGWYYVVWHYPHLKSYHLMGDELCQRYLEWGLAMCDCYSTDCLYTSTAAQLRHRVEMGVKDSHKHNKIFNQIAQMGCY